MDHQSIRAAISQPEAWRPRGFWLLNVWQCGGPSEGGTCQGATVPTIRPHLQEVGWVEILLLVQHSNGVYPNMSCWSITGH